MSRSKIDPMSSPRALRKLALMIALVTCRAEEPPKLDPPSAGTPIVSGHSTESTWPIRVKVFDGAGNLVEQRDIFAASDLSIVAGFRTPLEAGQIAQAYLLNNGTEMVPSAPVLVQPANVIIAVAASTRATGNPAAPPATPPSIPAPKTDPSDLGRVRYYFTSGVMLSSNQGFQLPSSSTQSGLFLALDADRAWAPLRADGFRWWNVNTYLDARLTSVATQQETIATTSAASFQNLTQSKKAASFEAGVYAPFEIGRAWQNESGSYSLFLAPSAKADFATLPDDQPTTSQLPVTGNFFKSYSYGARLGVFQHYASSSAAPRLVSYVDIGVGRFGNFEAYRDLTLDSPAASSLAPQEFLLVRPWRYSFDGLLKLPNSPFVLGFEANLGMGAWPAGRDANGVLHPFAQPIDDLRFLLGAQFDFSKLLKAIPSL